MSGCSHSPLSSSKTRWFWHVTRLSIPLLHSTYWLHVLSTAHFPLRRGQFPTWHVYHFTKRFIINQLILTGSGNCWRRRPLCSHPILKGRPHCWLMVSNTSPSSHRNSAVKTPSSSHMWNLKIFLFTSSVFGSLIASERTCHIVCHRRQNIWILSLCTEQQVPAKLLNPWKYIEIENIQLTLLSLSENIN